jgi:hypothetical protein
VLAFDGDQERMLGWVVGGMWGTSNGSLLGITSNNDGPYIVPPETEVVMLTMVYVPVSWETIGAAVSISVSLSTK